MIAPFVELAVGERVVKITNPDKVLFPARRETKRDLVDYYLSVGEGIVRALRERPTQLRRFPDGVEGEMIYQKRVPEKRPDWIEVARVTFPSGRHADELCVTELAQVAWAANLAVVDFPPLALAALERQPAVAASSSRTAGEIQKPSPRRNSSSRRSSSGRLWTGSPSQSSRSKATKIAGISADSLRMRLSAGCRRVCMESKSSTPSRAITISLSSAEWGEAGHRAAAAPGSSAEAAARCATSVETP